MTGPTLSILGPLRVSWGSAEMDAGPRQQRVLLALLLARPGEPTSITELVELLWGFDPPPTAVNVIHKYVRGLRRLLEPGLRPRDPGAYLARHGNWYRLTAGPEMLDLVRFRGLIAEATAGGDPALDLDLALDRYAEALWLWLGPAGAGLADTPGAPAVLGRLDAEFLDAVVAGAEIAVRAGRPVRLLEPLRRAAERDPLNEVIQARLVTTLAAAAGPAAALAAYESARRRLADELGIGPGRELLEAHRQVLAPTVPPPPDTVVTEIIELCGRLQSALGDLAAQLGAVRTGGTPAGRR